jgi:hypothetical protein
MPKSWQKIPKSWQKNDKKVGKKMTKNLVKNY